MGSGGGGLRPGMVTRFAGLDRVRVRATNALAPRLILSRTRRDLEGDDDPGAVSVMVGTEPSLSWPEELQPGAHPSPGTQLARPKSMLSSGGCISSC